MSLTYDALGQYRERLRPKAGHFGRSRKATAEAKSRFPLRLGGVAGLVGFLVLGAWAKPGMVVRLLPRMAEVYASIGMPVNLRGLAFEHVGAKLEEAGNGRFLTIEGILRNIAREDRDVPRLRLSLADKAGRPVYNWTASSGIKALPPGETAPFRARLAAPPAEAQQITVDLAPE